MKKQVEDLKNEKKDVLKLSQHQSDQIQKLGAENQDLIKKLQELQEELEGVDPNLPAEMSKQANAK